MVGRSTEATDESSDSDLRPFRIVFVCTGNICRSPMAEVLGREALRQAGLSDQVLVSSAGTGGWHRGDGMDPRASAELLNLGLDDSHCAAQLSEDDLSADLLVALDQGHRSHLLRAGADPTRVVLLRNCDPEAHDDNVEDPYYGDHNDFARSRVQIQCALPGLVQLIKGRLR